jgi:hypothetical protein
MPSISSPLSRLHFHFVSLVLLALSIVKGFGTIYYIDGSVVVCDDYRVGDLSVIARVTGREIRFFIPYLSTIFSI